MFTGTLEEFSLPVVLRLLARERKSGVLALSFEGDAGEIHLRDGAIAWASSFRTRQTLESRLTAAGLGERAPDGSTAFQDVATRHVSDALLDLVSWERGTFSLGPPQEREQRYRLNIDVDSLLEEMERKRARLDVIKREIPSLNAIVLLAKSPPTSLFSIRLTPNQWSVVATADGERSIAEIAELAGLDDATILPIVHDLMKEGLVELLVERDAPTGERVTLDMEATDVRHGERVEAAVRAPHRKEEEPAPRPPSRRAEFPAQASVPSPAPDVSDHPPVEEAGDRFDLVLICTANRARSPMVEEFVKRLARNLPVRVWSLGVNDLGPVRALPEAEEVAREIGIDLSRHRARALAGQDLSTADVVIGFERRHVEQAVRVAKAPVERTFTIVELTDLIAEVGDVSSTEPLQRAREVLWRAHQARRLVAWPSARIEIVDPFGGSMVTYRNTALRLKDLSRKLVRGLFGPPPPPPTSLFDDEAASA